MLLLGILQLLSHFYQRFLQIRPTTECINPEGYRMALDGTRGQGLSDPQEPGNIGTRTRTPKSRPSFRIGGRRVRICDWRGTLPEAERWETTPCSLLLSHAQRGRTKLRHLRARTLRHRTCTTPLAVAVGRNRPQNLNLFRSQEPTVIEITATHQSPNTNGST